MHICMYSSITCVSKALINKPTRAAELNFNAFIGPSVTVNLFIQWLVGHCGNIYRIYHHHRVATQPASHLHWPNVATVPYVPRLASWVPCQDASKCGSLWSVHFHVSQLMSFLQGFHGFQQSKTCQNVQIATIIPAKLNLMRPCIVLLSSDSSPYNG